MHIGWKLIGVGGRVARTKAIKKKIRKYENKKLIKTIDNNNHDNNQQKQSNMCALCVLGGARK